LADGTGLAADKGLQTFIRLTGFTNLADGDGWLDVNVNGSVTLKEVVGNLRLGLVRSRKSNVTLTAADSIVDTPTSAAGDPKTAGNDPQDVQANNITLTAGNGSIGREGDAVESDHDDAMAGARF